MPETMSETMRHIIEVQLDRVRHESQALFNGHATEALHHAILEISGKLLRPRLLLLAAGYGIESASGTEQDAYDWSHARQAALAIEVAHVGTLYHDDIVDCSSSRRGIPSVHQRYGEKIAALGGAQLLMIADSLMNELPGPLAKAWGRAALRVADGQLRETERTGLFDLEKSTYLKITRLKTATLFELAADLGARIGKVPADEQNHLIRVGRNLGISFQLIDDLHDFVADPAAHRPSGNDLRERVYTLPVLIAAKNQDSAGNRLRQLLRDDGRPMSPRAEAEVRGLLLGNGAFDRAAEIAVEYRDMAIAAVRCLSPGHSRSELECLALTLTPPPELVGDHGGMLS